MSLTLFKPICQEVTLHLVMDIAIPVAQFWILGISTRHNNHNLKHIIHHKTKTIVLLIANGRCNVTLYRPSEILLPWFNPKLLVANNESWWKILKWNKQTMSIREGHYNLFSGICNDFIINVLYGGINVFYLIKLRKCSYMQYIRVFFKIDTPRHQYPITYKNASGKNLEFAAC